MSAEKLNIKWHMFDDGNCVKPEQLYNMKTINMQNKVVLGQ